MGPGMPPGTGCASTSGRLGSSAVLRLSSAHQVRVGEVGPVGDAVHAARVLRDHRVPDVRKLAVLKHQEVCARAGARQLDAQPGSKTDGRIRRTSDGCTSNADLHRCWQMCVLPASQAYPRVRVIKARRIAQKTSRGVLVLPSGAPLARPGAPCLSTAAQPPECSRGQGAPCFSASLRSSAPMPASQLLKMSTCVLKTQISEPTWPAHSILLCCS